MATITASYTIVERPAPTRYVQKQHLRSSWELVRVTWAAIGDADTCTDEPIGHLVDKSVHVYGTFGGATVVIQGSDEVTPSERVTLNDSRGEGNPLSFTALDLRQVLEITAFVRPSSTGGGGSSTTVSIVGRVPLT